MMKVGAKKEMSDKPTIRVGFVDYFNPVDEFFIDVLSPSFDVVRDDRNPEYLFFCDENFGQANLQYDPRSVVKIFYTGENRRPWNYQCHHAITFDHMEGPQFYRFPLYALENWVNQKKLGWQDYRTFSRIIPSRKELKEKGFCSFVVRNGGCQERNDVFHKLSEYKRVDSGGPLYNNVGGPIDQDGFGSHITKTDFLHKRKFHIAYENSSYPGYVTEKILHGFLASTIPIYWGSPCVEMDFNRKAFVSRHDFRTTDDMIDYIKYLDNNDDAYIKILEEPIMDPKNRFVELSNLRNWFVDNVYRGNK